MHSGGGSGYRIVRWLIPLVPPLAEKNVLSVEFKIVECPYKIASPRTGALIPPTGFGVGDV